MKDKVFFVNGSHWFNGCVRKMIITEDTCTLYFKDKKTPTKFSMDKVFEAGVKEK